MATTNKRLAAKNVPLNLDIDEPAQSSTGSSDAAEQQSAHDERRTSTIRPSQGAVAHTGVGRTIANIDGNFIAKATAERDAALAKLAEFEGTLPVKKLDPVVVRRSALANRDESEFISPEFFRLKSEIESANGNVQPIRVRPVAGAGAGAEDNGIRYEIVFGHRRHRACLELGIPVLAMIEDAGEKELWLAMDRENRERKALSPIEQGRSIKRALNTGLFPSIRQLCIEAGIDPANAAKAVQLAELPAVVVDAFASPSDLTHALANKLTAALRENPDAVLERARKIVERGERGRVAKDVFHELITDETDEPTASTIELERDGKVLATIRTKPSGAIQVTLSKGIKAEALEAALRKLLKLPAP